MAPTPWNTGFALDIKYEVEGFTHTVRLPCDSPDSVTPYSLSLSIGGTRLVSDCANDFAQVLKPFIKNTGGIIGYELNRFDDPIFQPVEQSTMTVTGTSGGNNALGSIMTVTMRDLAYKIVKFIVMEPTLPAPSKFTYPDATFTAAGLLGSILRDPAATNPVGYWMRSHGGNQIVSITGIKTSYIRRLLRARGIQ